MTEPGNDNKHPIQGKRPATAALFLISAIIVVLIVIRHDNGIPTVQPEGAAPAQTAPAAPEKNDGTIDPAAITAWQAVVTKNGLDPAQFIAVYLQDTRAITVILSPVATPEIPAYEITLERGSHRVMGFMRIP